MAKRIVRRGSQRLRDELALTEALEPIEDAHQEAKAAFREALASGDPAVIGDAKQVKIEAANLLEATRTWLRREAAIVKLSTAIIPALEARLAGPILVKHGDDAVEDRELRAELEADLAAARKDLQELTAAAVVVRRELEALGGQTVGEPSPPGLPPGSAEVGLETVVVTARTKGAN